MSQYQTSNLFEPDVEETPCQHIIRVAFESAADTEFDYAVPDNIWPVDVGQRVEAPFGKKNKLQTGFCVELIEKKQIAERKFKLKKVAKVVDKQPLVDAELMELARWISDYYVCPLGQVLAAIVPAAVKRGAGVKTQTYIYLTLKDSDIDKTITELRGKKQKLIVTYLREQKAFDKDSAIELQDLLKTIDCGKEPVKRLTEKRIVKISQKTIFKSLPAIPNEMAKKTPERIVLNRDQQNALASIKEKIDSGAFGVTLLYGVTDSGKTELYIRAIQAVLKKGKSAVVLLPEIALTAQTVQRFSERFERIAVMHSGLTAAQRNVQWQKIKSSRADVVIGARSAVFAPLTNLGLIVVDEEHESSYKQDTAPRYHGRDVAIKRAQLAGAQALILPKHEIGLCSLSTLQKQLH